MMRRHRGKKEEEVGNGLERGEKGVGSGVKGKRRKRWERGGKWV